MGGKMAQQPDGSLKKTALPKKGARVPKKVLVLLGVVLVVVAAGGVYWAYQYNTQRKHPIICSADDNGLAVQASAALEDGKDINELKNLVEKIQSTTNYQQDPNCLYPIVQYYIMTNNQSEAQKYLDELKLVYKQEGDIYPLYSPPNELQSLQDQINNLTQINESIKANTTFF